MERYAEEERQIRQENVRLQRKLQMEIERREQMCRRLSESESSIEMDEERYMRFFFRCQSINDYVIVCPKVDQTAGQLSLKKLQKRYTECL